MYIPSLPHFSILHDPGALCVLRVHCISPALGGQDAGSALAPGHRIRRGVKEAVLEVEVTALNSHPCSSSVRSSTLPINLWPISDLLFLFSLIIFCHSILYKSLSSEDN